MKWRKKWIRKRLAMVQTIISIVSVVLIIVLLISLFTAVAVNEEESLIGALLAVAWFFIANLLVGIATFVIAIIQIVAGVKSKATAGMVAGIIGVFSSIVSLFLPFFGITSFIDNLVA